MFFFPCLGCVHSVKICVCVVTLYAQQKERKGFVLSWGLVINRSHTRQRTQTRTRAQTISQTLHVSWKSGRPKKMLNFAALHTSEKTNSLMPIITPKTENTGPCALTKIETLYAPNRSPHTNKHGSKALQNRRGEKEIKREDSRCEKRVLFGISFQNSFGISFRNDYMLLQHSRSIRWGCWAWNDFITSQ